MYVRGAKGHRTTRRETKAYAQTNGAVLCCAVLCCAVLCFVRPTVMQSFSSEH
jgi:hypothetical protein